MKEIVNVVVTCTKDKRYPVTDDCMLRSLGSGSIAGRSREWQRRLTRKSQERVLVRDLYAGDHWATVRSFSSAKFGIDIWVCSAGLGLVRLDDKISPYAATFSKKHPDSVTANLTDCEPENASSLWWKRLSKWKAHFGDRPRSLTELCGAFPKRSVLVVASKTYLNAVAEDLRDAIKEHPNPDLLSIVSAGVQTMEGLTENLIPCDARLQNVVSGARRSLNTRIAKKILSEARTVPHRTTLVRRYRKLLKEQPPIPIYDRLQLSDDEVRNFILGCLTKDGSLRHSPLLRRLRENNKACEQKRFARLFRQVQEERNGA